MPAHFHRFIQQNESPGVLLIPSGRQIGAVIEGLLMVWLNWASDDLRNQIRWIP